MYVPVSGLLLVTTFVLPKLQFKFMYFFSVNLHGNLQLWEGNFYYF